MIWNKQLCVISQPCLFHYSLEAWLCSLLYLIFWQPVLSIFSSSRQTIWPRWLRKKKVNGKGNKRQNSWDWRTRLFIFLPWRTLQFCSGQISPRFHYLKRAEKTCILVTLRMLTQDTNKRTPHSFAVDNHPLLHMSKDFCSDVLNNMCQIPRKSTTKMAPPPSRWTPLKWGSNVVYIDEWMNEPAHHVSHPLHDIKCYQIKPKPPPKAAVWTASGVSLMASAVFLYEPRRC